MLHSIKKLYRFLVVKNKNTNIYFSFLLTINILVLSIAFVYHLGENTLCIQKDLRVLFIAKL